MIPSHSGNNEGNAICSHLYTSGRILFDVAGCKLNFVRFALAAGEREAGFGEVGCKVGTSLMMLLTAH